MQCSEESVANIAKISENIAINRKRQRYFFADTIRYDILTLIRAIDIFDIITFDYRSEAEYRHERTTAITTDMDNLDRSIRNLIVPSWLILDHDSKTVLDSATRYRLATIVRNDHIQGHLRSTIFVSSERTYTTFYK